MDYKELESALRREAEVIAEENRMCTSVEFSRKLEEIADILKQIRHDRQAGIDASMGKRSGGKLEI